MKILQMTHLRVCIAVVVVVACEALECLLLVGTRLGVVAVALCGLVYVAGCVLLKGLGESSREP